MILLDAFALIAFLNGEPAADDVRRLLRQHVGMLSINLAEAVDILGRVHGVRVAEMRAVLDPLMAGPITVQMVTQRHVWRASEIRRTHYRRRACPLSLADCVLLAAAGPGGVATADPDILRVAALDGIATHPLPAT